MKQIKTKPTISHLLKALFLISLVSPRIIFAETFSIMVLPDTQYYTETAAGIFASQTSWISTNRIGENIIYVAHLGDIVDSECESTSGGPEWTRADTAMNTIDAIVPDLAYGVLPGNHDYDPPGSPCSTTLTRVNYNNEFGMGRFPAAGTSFYGGSQDGSTNNNNYTLFQSAGSPTEAPTKFIAINFAYSNIAAPGALITWADDLLKAHPDRLAILTAHFFLPGIPDAGPGECRTGTDLGPFGLTIWDGLKNNPNLFLMMSGHCLGERWINIPGGGPDRPGMGDVNLLLSNYQEYNAQASGYLRIMRFDTDPDANPATDDGNIAFETFSPTLPATGTAGNAASMNGSSATNFDIPFTPILFPSTVVLMDTSGSMTWDVNGVPGVPFDEQRIKFAKASAKAFLDKMWSAPSDPGLVSFGIAAFPAHPGPGDNADVITPLTRITEATRDAEKITIDGMATGGGTPMLTGIDTAMGMFTNESGKAILLLSDGYHNTPSTVDPEGAIVDAVVTSLNTATNGAINVYSVSFGKTNEIDYELLERLASDTGGEFFDATTPAFNAATWDPVTSLQAMFKSILTTSMDLDLIADPLGKIGHGENKKFKLLVNEQDNKVAIYLSWRTSKKGLLSLGVLASNGERLTERTPGVSVVHGENYLIVGIDRRALNVPGRVGHTPWQINIKGIGVSSGSVEPFQYSAIVDSGLTFEPSLDQRSYAVGDTITLTARVIQGRKPVLNLKDIEVLISAPDDGRGNWLATNLVTPAQLAKIPTNKGGEILTPFIRKGMYLTDIAGIGHPGQKTHAGLKLFDDGSHGDVKAKDGIYTNRFTNTQKEGVYSFYFRSTGPTIAGNLFSREKLIQEHLKVQPDADTIGIEVSLLAVDNHKRFAIKVTPKDRFNNFVGPGHNGLIRLETKNGKLDERSLDNLDGSYTRQLNIPLTTDERDVNVTIKIGKATKTFNLAERLKDKLRQDIK